MIQSRRTSAPWRVLSALLLASWLPGLPAQACEVWFDEWGRLRGNCSLADFFKEYELEYELNPTPLRLQLPNLRIHDLDYQLFGGPQVDLIVEVENTGVRDASHHELAIVVTVLDPLTQSVVSHQPLTGSFPSLAAGGSADHPIGSIVLPNRDQDWDLVVSAVIDPPTTSMAFGHVFESDEHDNVESEHCRVYGPDPDVTGPGPCR